nr:hypothetical protein [Tanacetum cinerariifolium]
MTSLTSLCELACQIVQKKQEEKRIEEEQAAKAQSWKFPVCYDDDDDEEGYNSLNDNIISELPSYSAVTPTEPVDSLIMEDEHLNTIPATESDEFIKSCVENFVPNPSESNGENGCDVPAGFTTFSNVLFDDDYDSDSSDDQSLSVEDTSVENLVTNPSESNDECECDVPVCDDFTTFFNLLFDADDDFSSSDNKSFSDEDISKEIYSNPLFDEEIISIKIDTHHFNAESDLIKSLLNKDSSIIYSSKIDSLLDEFAGELILLKSIPSRIEDADCDAKEQIHLTKKLLYHNSFPRPPKEINSKNSDAVIKSFSPSPIPVEDNDSLMEEIDLSLTSDDSMPPGIKNDDYDSKGDILILEELLSNDSLS